jgi:hypothetical protein
VRSLDEALRAMARWTSAKQRAERAALSALAALQQQPAAPGLHKALARLEGDVEAAAASGRATEAAQM